MSDQATYLPYPASHFHLKPDRIGEIKVKRVDHLKAYESIIEFTLRFSSVKADIQHALPLLAKRVVCIYSAEHRAWWLPNSSGYTEQLDEAGRYAGAGAYYLTRHCGREKLIEYDVLVGISLGAVEPTERDVLTDMLIIGDTET